MGSSSRETASRCTTEKVTGVHVFEIVGYSLKKGIGVGRFVRSATFAVGSHGWAIRVYPDGANQDSRDYLSVGVELMSGDAEVRVFFDLSLVKHASALTGRRFSPKRPRLFDSSDARRCRIGRMLILRSDLELETSNYLQDDRIVMKCVITVVKESQVYETGGCSEIEVPPSNIMDDLRKLLEAKEEADVTFSVGGETFQAHRILLAVRSPVFKAELYGPTRETRTRRVTIEDMQPAVFKALLHFIYTDSLPDLDDLEGDDSRDMIRHLLVAADGYAMDMLKMMCQNILGKNLGVENVATTLALADQYNCDKLKDVCIEFIASSDKMDDVVTTQGYANLKRSCPSVRLSRCV